MSDKSTPTPPTIRRAGDFLFIAGLTGTKDDGTLVGTRTPWFHDNDVDEQVLQAIRNLEKILHEAGGDLGSVVELSGYLVLQRDPSQDKNREDCLKVFEKAIVKGFGSHTAPACTPIIAQVQIPGVRALIKATAFLPVGPA